MRIEHMALNVANATEQAQWYVEHLGMTIVRHAENNQTHFIADETGQVLLELYTNPTAPVPDYAAMNPFVLHIAFAVDDIEAEHKRLLAAGASVEDEIRTTAASDKLVFMRDPWGVCLQLAQRSEPMF